MGGPANQSGLGGSSWGKSGQLARLVLPDRLALPARSAVLGGGFLITTSDPSVVGLASVTTSYPSDADTWFIELTVNQSFGGSPTTGDYYTLTAYALCTL